MKNDLKVKYLQYLTKKNKDSGFTLIELLVVIIIIGILSAIALPSFLNQAKKAKQSEAKTYTGSMNRGQQAYLTENDIFAAQADLGSASDTINALGLGIGTQTANYTYATDATNDTAVATNSFALSNSALAIAGSGLKNYAGEVYVNAVGAQSELTSIAFLCESINVGETDLGAFGAGTTACDTNTWKQLK